MLFCGFLLHSPQSWQKDGKTFSSTSLIWISTKLSSWAAVALLLVTCERGQFCLFIDLRPGGVLWFSSLFWKKMHSWDPTFRDYFQMQYRETSAVVAPKSVYREPTTPQQMKLQAWDLILQVLVTWTVSPDPKLDNVVQGRTNAVSMEKQSNSNHEKFGGAFCVFTSIASWNS